MNDYLNNIGNNIKKHNYTKKMHALIHTKQYDLIRLKQAFPEKKKLVDFLQLKTKILLFVTIF